MNKTIAWMLALYLAGTTAFGAEVSEPMHEEEPAMYVVLKWLYSLGGDIDEGEETIEGESGRGMGVDIGYRLGYGFAMEVDYSNYTNRVHKKAEGAETERGTARYKAYALDLLYSYHMTEQWGVFVKGGWEYEKEEIAAFDSTGYDNGGVAGIGTEYLFGEGVGTVVEYEHSFIDGPHGDSVFVGLLLDFVD